jgi:hypothetical protein
MRAENKEKPAEAHPLQGWEREERDAETERKGGWTDRPRMKAGAQRRANTGWTCVTDHKILTSK